MKGTNNKKDISIEVDNLPTCDTFCTDGRFAHNSPNGQNFYSIIVNQYGKSPIIQDITFNLILRDSHEVITGHCSGSLGFEAEHLS